MQTHPKKRIDVVVEALLIPRLSAELDRVKVSGYSIMPIIAGRGHEGPWTVDGQPGTANQMAALVCIVDASRADQVLASIFALISRQMGFVTVADVFVVRPERF